MAFNDSSAKLSTGGKIPELCFDYHQSMRDIPESDVHSRLIIRFLTSTSCEVSKKKTAVPSLNRPEDLCNTIATGKKRKELSLGSSPPKQRAGDFGGLDGLLEKLQRGDRHNVSSPLSYS